MTLTRLYVLYLNDMRSPKFEHLEAAAWAESRERLEAFIEAETVGLYHDGKWAKTFRQNGPLEWYNRVRDPQPNMWPPEPGSIREIEGAVFDGRVWAPTELTRANNADFVEMS